MTYLNPDQPHSEAAEPARPAALDAEAAPPSGNGLRRLDARELTGPQGQVLIVLDDKTYTLRITRTSKLILTK